LKNKSRKDQKVIKIRVIKLKINKVDATDGIFILSNADKFSF
jgi:translation initiation factor IF-3